MDLSFWDNKSNEILIILKSLFEIKNVVDVKVAFLFLFDLRFNLKQVSYLYQIIGEKKKLLLLEEKWIVFWEFTINTNFIIKDKEFK